MWSGQDRQACTPTKRPWTGVHVEQLPGLGAMCECASLPGRSSSRSPLCGSLTLGQGDAQLSVLPVRVLSLHFHWASKCCNGAPGVWLALHHVPCISHTLPGPSPSILNPTPHIAPHTLEGPQPAWPQARASEHGVSPGLPWAGWHSEAPCSSEGGRRCPWCRWQNASLWSWVSIMQTRH